MTINSVICSVCNAGVGVGCRTANGKKAKHHSARILLAESRAILVVPAVMLQPAVIDMPIEMAAAIVAPVAQIKQKFTLKGEPLPISVCMKALGYKLEKTDHGYDMSRLVVGDEDGIYDVFVFSPATKDWSFGYTSQGAAEFEAEPVTEAGVLMCLIKDYYAKLVKKAKPATDPNVLKSLAARLLPIATPAQLDGLRTQIKACAPAHV